MTPNSDLKPDADTSGEKPSNLKQLEQLDPRSGPNHLQTQVSSSVRFSLAKLGLLDVNVADLSSTALTVIEA